MNATEQQEAVIRKHIADRAIDAALQRTPSADLERLRVGLYSRAGLVETRVYASQVAKGLFVPGLPHWPWIEPALFGEAGAVLKRLFPSISTEATQLVDGSINLPPHGRSSDTPYAQPMSGNPAEWREWRLVRANEFIESTCHGFPITVEAIREVMAITGMIMSATFLVMRRGGSLPKHSDHNNVFASLWLPLLTRSGTSLTVAEETRSISSNVLVAFDHTYIHSSSNPTSHDRVVLSLAIPHPALTGEEKGALPDIVRSMSMPVAVGSSLTTPA